MKEILDIATKVSTPLALGGLFAAILFLIFRQIISKNIFPQLTRAVGGTLLKQIIDRLFVLALIAMILGFIGFIVVNVYPSKTLPPESFSVNFPDGLRLRDAIKHIATADSSTVTFNASCDDSFLDTEIEGGLLQADNAAHVIEQLESKLKKQPSQPYHLRVKIKENGAYEVLCK
jgi:hypothetical protein